MVSLYDYPPVPYYMKHINDTIVRTLEARIRVLKIELQDAVTGNADERKIQELQTAIQEYTIILNDLKAE